MPRAAHRSPWSLWAASGRPRQAVRCKITVTSAKLVSSQRPAARQAHELERLSE